MEEQSLSDAYKNSGTSEGKADAGKKLRIGIIGTGGIAEAHLQSYLRQPDVEIVAGADLIPGKAKAFFEKYGVKNAKTDYKDHAEMLADAGVVMSGTPHEVFSRAEELVAVGLNVPQVTRVAMELRRRGVDIDPAVYTVAELRQALSALKGGKAPC